MLIIDICTSADNLSNAHHNNIAGSFHSLGHRQLAVAPFVMAVDIVIPHVQISVADKRFVSGDLSGVQSRSHRKGFGYRSRLIRIIDAEIPPQCIELLHLQVVIHIIKILRGNIFPRHYIAYLIHHSHSIQILRIHTVIQVKIRVTCHSENIPRIYFHNNACRIITSVSFQVIVLHFIVELF